MQLLGAGGGPRALAQGPEFPNKSDQGDVGEGGGEGGEGGRGGGQAPSLVRFNREEY